MVISVGVMFATISQSYGLMKHNLNPFDPISQIGTHVSRSLISGIALYQQSPLPIEHEWDWQAATVV